ncbi:MAG: thioredoxin [Saprospiraceae bacterium]|nr:thioredoxin [Saprospiraceae bacterium]
MPRIVNKKNFDLAVLKHDQPVIVDVWADWCGPCKMLAPEFTAAEKALEGKARFVKLDADKNRKITKKYNVMALPSLLYFNDGKLVDRSSGVVSKDHIVKRVKPLLNEEDRKQLKGGFSWRFWE